MLLPLQLLPGRSPTIQLYGRTSGTAVGAPIAGVVVSGRPSRYTFDLAGKPAGDYTVDIADPLGGFLLRITSTEAIVKDEWQDMEVGTAYLWTNQAGDTQTVTIGEAP